MPSVAASRFQPHPELVPGIAVGPWLILERHDQGSFGLVFKVARAGHLEAGSFALKLALHPEDPRFAREVELLQRVVHPSVPRFEDSGWWTGPNGWRFPYVVMEWIEGTPLYPWAREQTRTSYEVLQVLAQLASALAAVHAAGGAHRDVKGDNVRVGSSGRAVLLDFGCGTFQGAGPLTDTALPPGTSNYRSPEALRWAWAHRTEGTPYEAGPPDDVYALGVTAYRLCTGTYPPQPTEDSGPPRRLLAPSELATVSMSLDRLLRAALSEFRFSRPPARALAISFAAAAREKDAAVPIVPTPAAVKTERASHPGPPRRLTVPTWVSAGAAAVISGLIVMAFNELRRPPLPDPSYFLAEAQRRPPSPEVPDAGVGDQALLTVVQPPPPSVASVMALPMPKTPAPGQKKPPCDPDYEIVALGACWFVSKKEPPCGLGAYEYEGLCVRASLNPPRQPTSEDPR